MSSAAGFLPGTRNSAESHRLRLLLRVVTVSHLALILATWPLWFSSDAFPAVPLTRWISGNAMLDRSAAILLVCGLLGTACQADGALRGTAPHVRSGQLFSGVALAAGMLLVLWNQHRLQPWHWFSLNCLLFCLILPSSCAVRSVRLMTASIYICSALSRLTFTPSIGMTFQIAGSLMTLTGFADGRIDPILALRFEWLMLGIEFLVGVLLLGTSSRCLGAILSVALHLILLVALGPVGLRHEAAVLIWNVSFLAIVPVLFLTPGITAEHRGRPQDFRELMRTVVIWLLVAGPPLSGLFGMADNWPSWQLYSPRPEVWKLFVRSDVVNQLPEAVRRHTGQPAPMDEWIPVRLDRWSLEATRSPLYPEDRFQLAVIENVIRGIRDASAVRVEIESPEFPLWWQRTRTTVDGIGGLRELRRNFILNSRCRGD